MAVNEARGRSESSINSLEPASLASRRAIVMPAAFLRAIAAQWAQLDPAEHPFVRQLATLLPGHDDREQFLAAIDLILAGIETVR
jgi:hypothetical protein